MPPHNSPRWRAEFEGRDDPLAAEIANRRARRGWPWDPQHRIRVAVDELALADLWVWDSVYPSTPAVVLGRLWHERLEALVRRLFTALPHAAEVDLALRSAVAYAEDTNCTIDLALEAAVDVALAGIEVTPHSIAMSRYGGGRLAYVMSETLTADGIVAEVERLRIELGPLDGQPRRRRDLLAPFFTPIGGWRGTTSEPDDRRAYEPVNLIDEPPVEAVDAPPVGLSASTRSFLAGLGDGGYV